MGSSLTTLHIYSSLVSICDYFLGYLLDSTDVLYLYVVLTPQKAPEEAVIEGYEGAIYVQCGQRRPHSLHFLQILFTFHLRPVAQTVSPATPWAPLRVQMGLTAM